MNTSFVNREFIFPCVLFISLTNKEIRILEKVEKNNYGFKCIEKNEKNRKYPIKFFNKGSHIDNYGIRCHNYIELFKTYCELNDEKFNIQC